MPRSTSQNSKVTAQGNSPLGSSLTRKLLGYSATVAACVAAAPDSEAVVVYNDFADVTLDASTQPAPPPSRKVKMSFDIDGDGFADIRIIFDDEYPHA